MGQIILVSLIFSVPGIIATAYYTNDNILFLVGFTCCLLLFFALMSITQWDRCAPHTISRSIKSNIAPPNIDETKTDPDKDNIYHNTFIDTSYGDTYIEHWQILNRSKDIQSYPMITIHGWSWPQGLTTAFIPYMLNLCDNDETIPISSITSYHLYGRGYSDTTLTPNNLPLFLSQISDIITSLHINGRLILAGYSMGGMISIAFAQKYPNRVHKLICISPAGFSTDQIPFTHKLMMNIVRMPLIGELFVPLFVTKKTVKNRQEKSINCEVYGDEAQYALDKMTKFQNVMMENNLRGYLYSLLSSLRYMPLFADFYIIYQALYKNDRFNNAKQWLFIWGMEDKTALCKKDEVLSETKIIQIEHAKHADIVQNYCIRQYADQLTHWLKN